MTRFDQYSLSRSFNFRNFYSAFTLVTKALSVLLAAAISSSLFAEDRAEVDSCTLWSDFSSLGKTNMISQGANNSGSQTNTEFQLVGELIYRPLKQTEEYYWLGFELYQSEVYINGEQSDDIVYSIPFAVKIDRAQGHVRDYAYNAELKTSDKSKLQGIYKALHIRPPGQSDNPHDYYSEDQDDMGVYQTRYVVDDEQVLKSREYYSQIGFARSGRSLVEIEDVQINEDLTTYQQDGCWITRAEGINDMRILTKADLFDISIRQQLDLVRRDDLLPKNARLLALPEDPEQWQILDAEYVYPTPEKSPESSGDLFLTRIAAMDLSEMSTEEILQYLFDNEEYIPLLKAPLWEGAYEEDFAKRLFLMIGKNDSNNAHWLLSDIYIDESFSDQDRFRSLMALKYSENPLSLDLVEQLFSYSLQAHEGKNQDLSHSALMVMGIIAKNQLDEEFGSYLSDRLGNELRGAYDRQTAAALLTAISNTGDLEHEYLVSGYLSSDDPLLRQRSAKALASMPSDRTLNTLSNQLVTESDTKVQSAILKGLGSSELDHSQLNQVYSFAESSADSNVRKSAINALANQLGTDNQVEDELRKLLKTETNKENMNSILQALY